MVKFVKKAFRVFFVVILWLTLIGCIVGGGIISYNMTHESGGWGTAARAGNPIPGILIGLVVGMFLNIVVGGCIATIINIDDNVEIIKNNLYRSNASEINSGETWECKKCKEMNPITAPTCKSCGAYK